MLIQCLLPWLSTDVCNLVTFPGPELFILETPKKISKRIWEKKVAQNHYMFIKLKNIPIFYYTFKKSIIKQK